MRHRSGGLISLALFGALGIPFVVSSDAEACVCFEVPRSRAQQKQYIEKELQQAVAVFLGEVVATDSLKATFKINRVWKGKLGAEVTIRTGARAEAGGVFVWDSCDWSYQRGQRYLIFAYGSSVEEMKAMKCTPTATEEAAGSTRVLLDEITRGTARNPLPNTYQPSPRQVRRSPPSGGARKPKRRR
jgi:hypothetical protein